MPKSRKGQNRGGRRASATSQYRKLGQSRIEEKKLRVSQKAAGKKKTKILSRKRPARKKSSTISAGKLGGMRGGMKGHKSTRRNK